MGNRIANIVLPLWRWLAERPGLALLTADEQRLADLPPRRLRFAWLDLMIFSLAWGVASVGVWGAAWGIFRDYSGLPLMPAVAVVAVIVLLVYRRGVLALAEAIGGGSPTGEAVAAAVTVLTLGMALLGIRGWDPDWPVHLPSQWQWLYPMALYRPLILAPLWGAWAMMILPQFVRPTERTSPAVAAFARGCGAMTSAVCLAVPLAGTLLYFHYLGWGRFGVPVAAVAAAIIGGLLLCRRFGGLCRRCLLASNVLTQIVFILAYLAIR